MLVNLFFLWENINNLEQRDHFENIESQLLSNDSLFMKLLPVEQKNQLSHAQRMRNHFYDMYFKVKFSSDERNSSLSEAERHKKLLYGSKFLAEKYNTQLHKMLYTMEYYLQTRKKSPYKMKDYDRKATFVFMADKESNRIDTRDLEQKAKLVNEIYKSFAPTPALLKDFAAHFPKYKPAKNFAEQQCAVK